MDGIADMDNAGMDNSSEGGHPDTKGSSQG